MSQQPGRSGDAAAGCQHHRGELRAGAGWPADLPRRGLAAQIRAELGFGEAALGAALAGAFLIGACAAPLGGRVADRIGGAWAAVCVASDTWAGPVNPGSLHEQRQRVGFVIKEID